MIVLGIDPGTGLNSPAAIFVFDAVTKKIIYSDEYSSKKKDATSRIREIALKIAQKIGYFRPDLFCIENFVMRGKGGETLQRFIGSLIPFTLEVVPFIQVQNTTVKKMVGGTGKAEKPEVALGVLNYFEGISDIQTLIDNEKWDTLDAAAIAISGYEIWKNGQK